MRFGCIDAHFVYPDGFAAVLLGAALILDRFHPIDKAEARSALRLSEDAKVVLALGQLAANKRHYALIQAVARLCLKFPNLKVFIVGEGVWRSASSKGFQRSGWTTMFP